MSGNRNAGILGQPPNQQYHQVHQVQHNQVQQLPNHPNFVQQQQPSHHQAPTQHRNAGHFRTPFEPFLFSSHPIHFWDNNSSSFVQPTSSRGQTPHGALLVYGGVTFQHLQILWKNRNACLEFLEDNKIETNIPTYGNPRTANNNSNSDNTTSGRFTNNIKSNQQQQSQPQGPDISEKERVISLLTSLGLSIPQQTVEPTEEDKLKEKLCGVLKGLGFNIPDPTPPPKEDLIDVRIRELETALNEQIKEKEKAADPRQRKLAELEALLSKNKSPVFRSRSNSVSDPATAFASSNIPSFASSNNSSSAELDIIKQQEDTIKQLQSILNNQDDVIQRADRSVERKGKR